MIKRNFLKSIAVATTLYAGLLSATGASEVTLSTQTALPTKHALSQSYIKHFLTPLNAQGKGIIQLNLLGGPEVTPANRAAQAMQRGVIDVLFIPAAYVAGVVPEAQAMMLQNIGIEKIRKNGAADAYDKIFTNRLQAHLLAWSETGPGSGYYLYTTKKPPMKDGIVDLKGLTLRTTGAYNPIQKALDATTVSIPSGDVPTGLQRGIIDGFGWPTVGLKSIGLAKLVKHRIEPSFYNLANVVLISDKKWASLSDNARKLITKVAHEYEIASVQEMIIQNKADIAAGDAAGVKKLEMTGDAGKKYLKIADDAMWSVVGKKVGADDLKNLRAMLTAN
jgi:TRAP-type C4-dicarboxylate transport system substrate-binding protein